MFKASKRIWLFILLIFVSVCIAGCDKKPVDNKDANGDINYDYTDLSVRDFVSKWYCHSRKSLCRKSRS